MLRDSDNSTAEHAEAVASLMDDFREEANGDVCWALANACDGLTEK
jgi:hypothetical protein